MFIDNYSNETLNKDFNANNNTFINLKDNPWHQKAGYGSFDFITNCINDMFNKGDLEIKNYQFKPILSNDGTIIHWYFSALIRKNYKNI